MCGYGFLLQNNKVFLDCWATFFPLKKYDTNIMRVTPYLHILVFAHSLCLLLCPSRLPHSRSIKADCVQPKRGTSLRWQPDGKAVSQSIPSLLFLASAVFYSTGSPSTPTGSSSLWTQRTSCKRQEHLQILVTLGGPETNPPWIYGRTTVTDSLMRCSFTEWPCSMFQISPHSFCYFLF